MTEQKDIYTRFRQFTGRSVPRPEKLKIGEYSLAVRIWIRSGGRFLIQRRQPFKARWGGVWDCSAAGCVSAGESSRRAAARELGEELGIVVRQSELQWICTTLSDHRFDDVYLLEREVVPDEIRLQAEEVAQVKLAGCEEIRSLSDSGGFVPYEYLDTLRELFEFPLRLCPCADGFEISYRGEGVGRIKVIPSAGTAEIACELFSGMADDTLEAAVLLRVEQMLPQYTRLRIRSPLGAREKTQGFCWILQRREL